jgi:hypothetical protein
MAADDRDGRAYTTLGIIAVGQGGGNIAIQFLTRKDNPGIDERVVLVNTNDTDIMRNIDRNESDLAIDRETLSREHVETFGGASVGVGNDFFEGERLAEEDFETIFRPINNKISGSEALMYSVALGGGSGNGSVPYIIDQLSQGPDGGKTADMNAAWLDGITQFALAAWPFDYESAQRHYNAICGLSRLLMREDGEPNADMTILASNTRLKELALQDDEDDVRQDSRGDYVDDKTLVNERIIDAIDLFISAGRLSESTIDVKDYVEKPQLHGAYHGTFGTAMEKPTGLDIDLAIESAVENAFVPLDPSTAKAAYVIVRAPERKMQSGEVTMGRVGEGFAKWKAENGLRGTVGMETLAQAPGRRNSMDVLVFLAGFDLGPLFEESWEFYETEKEGLRRGESTDQLARVDRIEENLRQYRNRLEE